MERFLLPVVHEWAEWEAIFGDAALWPPVIEHIWAADPALAAVTGIAAPGHIEAGYPGTCAVLIVDRTAVIKIFPPPVAHDWARERAVYRLSRPALPYAPELLAEGVYRDRVDWPYLALSYLPGAAWREAETAMPAAEQRAIMADLGRAIRTVHDAPLPAAGAWPAQAAWEAFLNQRLPQVSTELRARTTLPHGVIGEIEATLARTDWYATAPCLLHADLTEDHLLVSRGADGWRITGLIDWADAEVGDVTYEWVALWFGMCHRRTMLLNAFLAGYDPARRADDLDIDRLTAFTFLHRFGTGILGDVLAPEEQRAVDDLTTLQRTLFSGLLP